MEGTTPASSSFWPNEIEVCCDPRALWWINPGAGCRCHRAISRASVTSSALRWSAIAPPTSLREVGVQHECQMVKAFPGRHIRDVGHPQTIARPWTEVPLNEILCRYSSWIPAGSARRPLAAAIAAFEPLLAHEPRHVLVSDPDAIGTQLGEDSLVAVGASGVVVDLADAPGERDVGALPLRRRPYPPSVVA